MITQNFTLFSHPLVSSNKENELSIILQSECEDFFVDFTLITQNDLITHNNKDNPIIPYYKQSIYKILDGKRRFLNYTYQYIKYESDDGFFLVIKKL